MIKEDDERVEWDFFASRYIECASCPAGRYCYENKDEVWAKSWSCGETIWHWLKEKVKYE